MVVKLPSLTLTDKHRLRGFHTGVTGKIFVTNVEEVIRGWKKLQEEEVHDLYPSPNIMGKIMDGEMCRVACHLNGAYEKRV